MQEFREKYERLAVYMKVLMMQVFALEEKAQRAEKN
jgi:hypothetical protein